MIAIKGSVAATYEAVDSNDTVTACVDCRIHFAYRPGDPGCWYQRNGDPGWPPEPAEVEVDFIEVETLVARKLAWVRYPDPWLNRSFPDLNEWAQNWLDEHPHEVDGALPQGPDPDDARDAAMERAWEDRA